MAPDGQAAGAPATPAASQAIVEGSNQGGSLGPLTPGDRPPPSVREAAKGPPPTAAAPPPPSAAAGPPGSGGTAPAAANASAAGGGGEEEAALFAALAARESARWALTEARLDEARVVEELRRVRERSVRLAENLRRADARVASLGAGAGPRHRPPVMAQRPYSDLSNANASAHDVLQSLMAQVQRPPNSPNVKASASAKPYSSLVSNAKQRPPNSSDANANAHNVRQPLAAQTQRPPNSPNANASASAKSYNGLVSNAKPYSSLVSASAKPYSSLVSSDPHYTQKHWQGMYQKLLQYKAEHGDANVPSDHDRSDPALVNWVVSQRYQYNLYRTNPTSKSNHMNPERIRLLEAVGFVWDIRHRRDERWDERFRELVEYKKEHGSCSVSKKVNNRLGIWVLKQRKQRREWKRDGPAAAARRGRYGVPKEVMEERFEKLEALGFEWEPKQSKERSKAS